MLNYIVTRLYTKLDNNSMFGSKVDLKSIIENTKKEL